MTSDCKKNNVMLWAIGLVLGIAAVINQQYISYHSLLLKFIVTIVLIGLALFLILKKTKQGSQFCYYWHESVVELKKVTWPSRKETMQTTMAVLGMVVVMGIILWTVDSILIRVVAWLIKRGGV